MTWPPFATLSPTLSHTLSPTLIPTLSALISGWAARTFSRPAALIAGWAARTFSWPAALIASWTARAFSWPAALIASWAARTFSWPAALIASWADRFKVPIHSRLAALLPGLMAPLLTQQPRGPAPAAGWPGPGLPSSRLPVAALLPEWILGGFPGLLLLVPGALLAGAAWTAAAIQVSRGRVLGAVLWGSAGVLLVLLELLLLLVLTGLLPPLGGLLGPAVFPGPRLDLLPVS
ncbi:MAG TPA: hypothetical protein PKG95_06735 [Anaerolineaceae bacterium]|nr:hypothetical protein [Anaerolineaceae bacterium]